MTKELGALEKIGNLHSITKGCAISYTDEYKVIKQALLELQAIKNAEPIGDSLEYGKWYPIEEYYKRSDKLDWALVQFKETKTGFMPLPYRAEYIKRYGVWSTGSSADRYLCELCEPVAFMLWKPYKEMLE